MAWSIFQKLNKSSKINAIDEIDNFVDVTKFFHWKCFWLKKILFSNYRKQCRLFRLYLWEKNRASAFHASWCDFFLKEKVDFFLNIIDDIHKSKESTSWNERLFSNHDVEQGALFELEIFSIFFWYIWVYRDTNSKRWWRLLRVQFKQLKFVM